MTDFAREDRRMTDYYSRSMRTPVKPPTQKEKDMEDAAKFEAIVQAQLRDLMAGV